MSRRYDKVANGEGTAPDLILIDGGKGQVASAYAALADLGLSQIPMIGVAKGEERKPGPGNTDFPRGAGTATIAAGTPGPASDSGSSRRSPPLCHHRPSGSTWQGAQDLDAGKLARGRPGSAQGTGCTLWRFCPEFSRPARKNWQKSPASVGSWPKKSIQRYIKVCHSICPSCSPGFVSSRSLC